MNALSESFVSAVRKTPLLTAEEEHDLACAIWEARRDVWRGLFQDALAVSAAMSACPEDAKTWRAEDVADADCDETALAEVLAALAKQGHTQVLATARENVKRLHELLQRFARANIGLVMRGAQRSARRELGYQDTFGEGLVGLMTAVRRFDPQRGTRFSTFAVWWIRHAIGRAIQNKSRTVRIPAHARSTATRIARESNAYEAKHGSAPSAEYLAKQLGVSERVVRSARRVSLAPVISLDPLLTQHSEDDARPTLVARLADEAPLAEELLEREEDCGRLAAALKHLSPTARDIVERRYGLNGGRQETLREVGELHALSRERIRQIENAALEKLGSLLRP